MVREKTLKHGIKLNTTINGIPDLIRIDERKVKQIIYNLLSNAVKFTPEDGEVKLGVRTVDGVVRSGQRWTDSSEIKIFEQAAENADDNGATVSTCMEFAVSDTGIGIKAEHHGRIFDAFEQVDGSTSRRYEGTGLGLSLTKKLVELHGGKIWVESKGENKGSTFRFIVPLYTA